MLVVQTAAEPPNQGRMDLLTINCIWKSKNALRNEVDAKSSVLARGGFAPKLEFAALRGSPVLSPIIIDRCEMYGHRAARADQSIWIGHSATRCSVSTITCQIGQTLVDRTHQSVSRITGWQLSACCFTC